MLAFSRSALVLVLLAAVASAPLASAAAGGLAPLPQVGDVAACEAGFCAAAGADGVSGSGEAKFRDNGEEPTSSCVAPSVEAGAGAPSVSAQACVLSGSDGLPGAVAMKKGTVKFFNER